MRQTLARTDTGTRVVTTSGPARLRGDWFVVVVAGALLSVTLLFALADATSRASMEILATISALTAVTLLVRSVAAIGVSTDIGICVLLSACIFWFYGPAVSSAFTPEQWNQQAAYLRINNSHALKAFVSLNLFVFVLVTSYQLSSGRKASRVIRQALGRDAWPSPRRILVFLALLAGAAFTFYVVTSGGFLSALGNIASGRTLRKPWDSDGNYGTGLSPFHIICTGSLIFASSFGSYLLVEGRFRGVLQRVLIAGIVVVCAAAVIVESGTRSVTLHILAPSVFLYFRHRIAGSILRRAHRLLPIAFVAVAALAVANLQLLHRTGQDIEGAPTIEVQHNDFFTKTAFGFEARELIGRLLYDSAIVLIASGPVPRILWRGKPEPQVVVEFSSAFWGRDITVGGGNTMPSVLGQYYMSWGWFGIVEIGFGLGVLARWGDVFARTVRKGSPLLFPYAAFLTYVFIGFRFLGFNFFSPVVLACLWVRLLTGRRRDKDLRVAA